MLTERRSLTTEVEKTHIFKLNLGLCLRRSTVPLNPPTIRTWVKQASCARTTNCQRSNSSSIESQNDQSVCIRSEDRNRGEGDLQRLQHFANPTATTPTKKAHRLPIWPWSKVSAQIPKLAPQSLRPLQRRSSLPLVYQKHAHLKRMSHHLASILMTCATRQNNAFGLASQQLFCARCVTAVQLATDHRLCDFGSRHACANNWFHSPQVPYSNISSQSTIPTPCLQSKTITISSLGTDLMRQATQGGKAPIRYKDQRLSTSHPLIAPPLLASSLIVA
jgi:hypothetical protein